MIATEVLKQCTPEAFAAMEKEEAVTYELIDGVVMMSPRPAAKHQTTSGNLYAELRSALYAKNCHVILEFELILGEQHFVPDLMISCGDKFEGSHHEKLPSIVIEIVSPSSVSRDCFVKRLKYEQLGIQEYWIVSPDEQCIDVFCFAAQSHTHYCTTSNATLHSCVIPELRIALEAIFES